MLNAILHSWPSAITVTMTLASGAVLLLAACHDLVSRTVPNWMPSLIAGFGLVAAFAGDRLLISAGLGAAVFIAAALCWRRGWLGAGLLHFENCTQRCDTAACHCVAEICREFSLPRVGTHGYGRPRRYALSGGRRGHDSVACCRCAAEADWKIFA